MKRDWLDNRITYIRGLRKPSDQQRLLLILAEKPDRSPDDERKLAALVRAERAADRARSARAAAGRVVAAERDVARKARTRRLIELGGLVDLAGLADMDRGTLLGLMLAGSNAAADDEKAASWKKRGDAAIAAREADKANSKKRSSGAT